MKLIPQAGKLLTLLALFLFIASCSNDDNGGQQARTETENTDVDSDSSESDSDSNAGDGSSSDSDSSNGESGNENETNATNIVEIVVATDELSGLEEAVITADLVNALSAEGPFTLFAPTDEAVNELFDLLGEDFNSFADFDTVIERQILELILLYHVVPGNLTSSDLMPGVLETLATEETIEIIDSNGTFVIGDASEVDANITSADNTASNGVVHIVDKILIPQDVQEFLDTLDIGGDNDDSTGGLPTISEIVVNTDELEFLEQALELTGLLETLNGDGPFTVFAPTSETLLYVAGLLGNSIDDIESFDTDFEIEVLKNVLLYHVLQGEVYSNDLAEGTITTLLGDELEIVATEDGFVLRDAFYFDTDLDISFDANFVLTDIPAGNGVIHIINRVLVAQSVVDTIISETEETLIDLASALQENDMVITAYYMVRDELGGIIENGEPFTFFLPTNQAFLALFDSLDGIDSLADFDTEEELELLATILSYHFIRGTKATSSQLTEGQIIGTLQGENIMITLSNGVGVIDKTGAVSKVTEADIQVGTGVVHIINKVLLPQAALDRL